MSCACRTLLAAVAVSCTLSRIHANGPSTQRLDRIKDLMCVLLLSGIQKDELDANTLNKLQRYNVNIHDLNNNELLRECATFQSLHNENISSKTHGIGTRNNMEKYNPKIRDKNTDKNDNLTNFNAYEYLYKNTFQNINNNKEHNIQYTDGKPELQSVLKFWKDININNSIRTTKSPIKLNTVIEETDDNVRSEQKNKRNIQDTAYFNESDSIQRLIVNFLLKNQNKNIVKQTTKNNDIGDQYDDKKNVEINENDKSADISPTNIKAKHIEPYSLNKINRNNKNLKDTLVSDRDSESEKPTPINSNNFNDIIEALQSFKTYYPIIPKDKKSNNFNPNNKQSLTSSENLYLDKFVERENIYTTEQVIAPKLVEQTFSQNVIKEIAKNVKELVLKDLRKEIFETTTNYLTTITPITTERGKEHAEQSILNKFMDLFEEIKTLNHKTLIISSEIRKETTKKEELVYPVIPSPFNGMEPISYYRTKQYHNINSQKIFDFSPQIHRFRSNVVSESVTQVPIKPTLPITVQTNNMEIPPLGIPIDIPENPINQNIIVSTIKPYRIGEYKDYNNIKQSDSRIGKEYISKQSQIRFVNTPEPTHYYSNHQNDKMFSSNKEQFNYNMNFNDKITDRHKEAYRSGEIKHSNIPRFHEKLEKGIDYYDMPRKEYTDRVDCCNERNAYSKQMVECCNRKIASRHQMSLSNVKKQPSYDDTHFKNFLKSQQKVTDMLERILASRSRVRSVETA